MTSANVLPAYAGMIHALWVDDGTKTGAPRVCGDDPVGDRRLGSLVECSPRMRG